MHTPSPFHLGAALATALGLALAGPAQAHGDATHATRPRAADAAPAEPRAYGREGDPAKVVRTVRVDMHDRMRFTPADLVVRRGDTVRFVVHNGGRVLHEMVLGTVDELRAHAELMRRFPDMEHDEPNMVHVKPGARGSIVWQFDQPGVFQFACLIPGHFEAGMVGKLTVR